MARAAVYADPSTSTVDADVGSLVTAAAAGDNSAFASLYDRYAQRVFNMILRSVRDHGTAEDVAQDVWTKAHRELRTLREPRCFPAWLYRIAAKKCIDAARRRKRRPEAAPLSDDMSARFADPERSVIAREDTARVWEALAGLTPKQHMALYLREVEQRSYREIAYVLRISETAVGLCIFRARRSLAAAYEHLREAPRDACASTQRVMSLSLDGHATPIQQRALTVHIDRCQPCRADFSAVQSAARGYAGLVLAPAPLAINEHVVGMASSAHGGGAFGIGKLIAWLAPNAKAAALSCTLAVAAGATTVAAAPRIADVIRADAPPQTAAPVAPIDAANEAQQGAAADVPANAVRGTGDPLGPPFEAPLVPPPPDALLPEAQLPATVALPPPGHLLDDTAAVIGGTLDSTVTTLDATLDGALTTVDATLDETLTTVDETLTSVEETVEEIDTTVDETIDDVDETVGDVLDPVLGPPSPPADSSPEPEPTPTPTILEPIVELLPGLP